MSSDSLASGARAPDDPLYAPGLKWRPRANGEKAAYWIPPASQIKAGWLLKSVALPKGLTQDEIAAKCRALWDDLAKWRSGQPAKTHYSIAWLVQRYQTDEYSPYHFLKERTRRGYDQSMVIIEDTVGSFLIDAYNDGGLMRPRILGRDLREWHRRWAEPDETGKPRPVRAWHAIAMLRILFAYALELGVPGADALVKLAGKIRIPTPQAREAAPERTMVLAHVNKAVENGLLSMAIATLAQFEFTERRTHIIGTWENGKDGRHWRPGWLWSGITPKWMIRYHQTKVGKVEREYDLTATPALLEMLQRIPQEKRIGPVIVCERTGKPWKERHFMRVWRAIAREIGMPDGVWSMDMRAGAATETGQLPGITTKEMQDSGGWRTADMVSRYDRGARARAQRVVSLRQAAAARAKDKNGGERN